MAKGKRIVDCSIIVAELLAVPEDIHRIIIPSDSQVVVNSISSKVSMPKGIINLVDDIRRLLVFFSDSRIKYCYRGINYEADSLAKMAIM